MKFLFDTSKVINKVTEMNEALEKMREKYQNEAQGLFEELTSGFFRAYPEVKNIFWTQYTPHFMDGDDCVFSVNDIYYTIDRSYDRSKFAGSEDTASEWDVKDDEDDEDEDFEFDEEGDQFSTRSVAVIDGEISRYENFLIVPPTHYNWSTNGHAFEYKHRGGWGAEEHTFSEKTCREHIAALKAELATVRAEIEQYPNRDDIVAAIEQVKTFIKSVDEDLMQDIFGDHVRVVLDKDGTSTFEYEHE